ncbi:flagellar biosynthetic protein FliO [Cellulomonas sp. Y8]|uniref:flagellar biosynthetic protein FliO n=1 Tax=Cellulomonas sp. Y8 TaxID=2591145 RepID=UPI0011C80D33|nr:flagellar biosynthetic protein FliO [Cellulomonas sp. Y8]
MDTLVLGLRVLLALACVIGLIWVLARRAGWGKGRRRPAGPAVEVVGRQALGRHAGVVVVAVGDRRLLLGYGEQHVTMLTELDAVAEEEASDEEAAAPAAPLTLGALAAAVLPTPRRTRAAEPAAAPAAPAPVFEDALAEAAAAPVPGLVGLEVADVDAARLERMAAPAAQGALHGSVLAPSTWKQAVAVLRERTVRR